MDDIHYTARVPTSDLKDYRYAWFRGKKMMLHRAVAERALGKPLPPKAIVHHVNGRAVEGSALVICENQQYHFLLHTRQRVLEAGGDPNTQRRCSCCQQLKSFAEFSPSALARGRNCRACDTAYAARRRIQVTT